MSSFQNKYNHKNLCISMHIMLYLCTKVKQLDRYSIDYKVHENGKVIEFWRFDKNLKKLVFDEIPKIMNFKLFLKNHESSNCDKSANIQNFCTLEIALDR